MIEIGVGYLTLGQSADTLSGGEIQRIRLAAELAKSTRGHTLYIFDEPTAGLHQSDVELIFDIWNRLVDLGNTVVVAEHMQELIAGADCVIDLSK
ncbi:UNVERIFIED_CONTAM: hypothetical protein GTU68_048748 [Idotea baltica]|nr:hypothetical protein [Idotea baltica]